MTIATLDTMAAADSLGSDATAAVGTGATGSGVPAVALPAIDAKRYVVRAELARGGMGKVSIAFDTALGRDVAIKELLVPHGDLASRFRRELALTARLQHPGIVTIHDGGTWHGGEHVYVMRLVKGASLDSVIAKTTNTRERLALLPNAIAVVHALAYAHAQKIIHRDLKPANILVGDFGETVVIDWGIAKALDQPDVEPLPITPYRDESLSQAQTQAGAILGTPAYMAPEQALGDTVDARTDVYALGAVLYHLLAGRAPHTGPSLAEVLASVLSKAPAALPADVPPDLVAIVTKAMATEPEARYATAGELAADLERFHAGQLVGAHSYTPWQLVRRWLGRHRTPVLVGALAALVLAVVGVASITRIVREQRRSAAAELVAEDSRREAERQLDFMLVELRAKLEPVGKVDLLATVATQAQDYYRRRPPIGDDDQHRRILTHHNLGAVLAAQGKATAALVEFRHALVLATTLVALAPGNESWLLDLAVSHRLIGNAQGALDNLTTALASYRAALAISERAPADEARWQDELARDRLEIGDVLRAQDNDGLALASYRAALEVATRRLAAAPDDAEAMRRTMIAHNKVGTGLRKDDDFAGALTSYRAANAIAKQLVTREPTNVIWLRDLAISHDNIGRVHKAKKDYAAALAEYAIGVELSEKLAARDPLDTTAQRDLAISLNVVAKVRLEQKDFAGALAGYRRSLAIREQLAARDPSNTMWQRDLSVNHYMVGDVLEDSGDFPGAMVEYRQASAIADEISAKDPTNASWRKSAQELRETVETCCKAAGN